jgi:hypothetical protein
MLLRGPMRRCGKTFEGGQDPSLGNVQRQRLWPHGVRPFSQDYRLPCRPRTARHLKPCNAHCAPLYTRGRRHHPKVARWPRSRTLGPVRSSASWIHHICSCAGYSQCFGHNSVGLTLTCRLHRCSCVCARCCVRRRSGWGCRRRRRCRTTTPSSTAA